MAEIKEQGSVSSEPENEARRLSPEEYQERVWRLESMGKVIGEDFGMAVDVGTDPGWRYRFKPINKIEADPNDVANRGLEFCFGVIAHEGAHRKISRVDFIPKKVWQAKGFSFLMNAIEDPRVNNWVSEKYDGAKGWLQEVYNQDIPTENKIEKTSKEKVGYVPKHICFGLEVIRHWHTGEFSADLPEDVRRALLKTSAAAQMAHNNTPDAKNPTEEDIAKTAKGTYRVVYSSIWPEYQKLVDKAYEDEKTRQQIKEMIENGEIQPDPAGQGQGGEPMPLDEFPEELKEAIKKKLKEKLDSMTEEERKKFEENAEKKAGDILDDLENEVDKDLRGKFSEQPDTKAEERKKKEAADKEGEIKKTVEDLKKKIEAEMEKNKTEYEKAYEAVQPFIDKVAEDIINLLVSERWPKFRKAFPGQKLRLEGAMKYESRKDYKELFERRGSAEKKGYAFLLLTDLSGSMQGAKINETFKGVVLFTEALNRISATLGGVKVALYGFQGDLLKYKDFGQPLDDELRERMGTMKEETESEGAAYNSDGFCLDKAAKILEGAGEKNNFLFVLSDGQPAGDDEHHVQGYGSDVEELQGVVKDISKKGNVNLLGIGLGPGTEHVAIFYPNGLGKVNNIPNVRVGQLADTLAGKLEELIK